MNILAFNNQATIAALPIEALSHLRLYLELGQIVNLSSCNKYLRHRLSLPQAVGVVFSHNYLETKAQVCFGVCTIPPQVPGTRCWFEVLPLSSLSHPWVLTLLRPQTGLIVSHFDSDGGYKYVVKAVQGMEGEPIPRELLFNLCFEKRVKPNKARRALKF